MSICVMLFKRIYVIRKETKKRTLQSFSFKLLLLFGNTHICESAFCTMNLMKHEFRNHIDNLPLEWWIRLI